MPSTPVKNRYSDLLKKMDLQIKYISLLIVIASFFVTIVSIIVFFNFEASKRDFDKRFDSLSKDIETKFDTLSNQFYKKRELIVFYKNNPINNNILIKSIDNSTIRFSDVIIENIGNVSSSEHFIKLYLSKTSKFIPGIIYKDYYWEEYPSPLDEYPFLIVAKIGWILYAKEKRLLPDCKLIFNNHDKSDIDGLLQIFYESDKPLEIPVILKFK